MNKKDELAERYFGVIQRMVDKSNYHLFTCEFCGREMTEENFDFCDICPDCRDEEGWI